MIYLRRVVGQSMLPTLRPGQLCVFVKRRHFQDGDVVFAVVDGRPVVKRAYKHGADWRLRGDNSQASTNYTVTLESGNRKLLAKLVFPRARSVISQS